MTEFLTKHYVAVYTVFVLFLALGLAGPLYTRIYMNIFEVNKFEAVILQRPLRVMIFFAAEFVSVFALWTSLALIRSAETVFPVTVAAYFFAVVSVLMLLLLLIFVFFRGGAPSGLLG